MTKSKADAITRIAAMTDGGVDHLRPLPEADRFQRVAGHILAEGDYFPPEKPTPSSHAQRIADWIVSEEDSWPQPPASAPVEQSREDDVTPRMWDFDVDAMNREYALVTWGSKAVVIKEQASGPIEDRIRILSLEAFRAWFANGFTEIRAADGKIKTITLGAAWLQHPDRRQFQGVDFFPNPDGAPSAPGYLNLWRGFSIEPSANGTWDVLRDHLLNNVCNGDAEIFEWMFAWFAHLVQRPRERVGTAIVLRGGMGVGKSKVGEIIGSLFPAHYFQVDDPRYITGQFNPHQAACLLLQAEEAMWAGDKAAEGRIKGLITSSQQMIEAKGIDPIRIQNFVRVLMTSNEDWVVPAGLGERRFCVLDVNPRCAQNHDYFRAMDEELAAGGLARLLYDLMHFDLSKINLRKIPMTRALLEQKMRSFDPLESWWFNCLSVGAPTRASEGWQPEVICGVLYDDYVKTCDTIGVGRKRDAATFGARFAKLVPGVIRHQARRYCADGEAARRVWMYALPPLDECRKAFDTIVGQSCDWPALLAGEDEAGETEDNADDYVPL